MATTVKLVMDGKSLGTLTLDTAMKAASETGKTLRHVGEDNGIPVYLLQGEKPKKEGKSKGRTVKQKEVQLSLRMAEGDKIRKFNQVQKFINKGNRVLVRICLQGRERTRTDLVEALFVELEAYTPLERMGGKGTQRLYRKPVENKK